MVWIFEMKVLMSRRLFILVCGLWLVGCERWPEPSSSSASAASTNETCYQVKGVVKEIRAGGRKALIAHEDIPGYMEAMNGVWIGAFHAPPILYPPLMPLPGQSKPERPPAASPRRGLVQPDRFSEPPLALSARSGL